MVDLCRSFMLEAKWFYTGYKPSFQEYIENAWISIAAPVVLVHAYFLVTNPITKEALECLEGYPDIIRWSSLIVRLTDDLGTSKVRVLQIASSHACIQYMITPKYIYTSNALIPGLFENKQMQICGRFAASSKLRHIYIYLPNCIIEGKKNLKKKKQAT